MLSICTPWALRVRRFFFLWILSFTSDHWIPIVFTRYGNYLWISNKNIHLTKNYLIKYTNFLKGTILNWSMFCWKCAASTKFWTALHNFFVDDALSVDEADSVCSLGRMLSSMASKTQKLMWNGLRITYYPLSSSSAEGTRGLRGKEREGWTFHMLVWSFFTGKATSVSFMLFFIPPYRKEKKKTMENEGLLFM